MAKESKNDGVNEKEEDSDPTLVTPPDGGWGWVIVFSSLMCNILVDGIGLAYGVLLPKFAEYFDAPKSKVSLVGSLMIGTYLCAGPIVSGLVNAFGCRKVTVIGSIVACLGFVVGSFSPNLNILILTYGVIGGFGFGMIYLPSIVSVGFYFEKKRPIATGIAVCGSGIGTFMFSPVLQILSDTYDWKNLLLIMAGIILNAAVCGMLMRPLLPKRNKKSSDKNSDTSSDSGIKIDKASVQNEEYQKDEKTSNYQSISKDGIEFHEIEPFIPVEQSSADTNGMSRKTQRRSSSLNDLSKFQKSQVKDTGSTRLQPRQKFEIIYSGSLLHIPQFTSHPNLTHSQYSVLSTHAQRKTIWDKCDRCLPESVLRILKEMLDFSVLLNIPFLMLCIGNIFAAIGFFIPFYYIVDRALILGVSSTEAAFLLSIIGITNTIGRVLSGFLTNIQSVSALVVNNVALIIASAVLFLQPLCTIYSTLIVFCVVFGFCAAAYISLTSIILCDLLGVHRLASAFGLLTLARGIAGVVGPPVAGIVFQETGSYDASFYFGGAMFLIGGLFHLLLHFPCIKRCIETDKPEAIVTETVIQEIKEI